jgi:hypothetical protein
MNINKFLEQVRIDMFTRFHHPELGWIVAWTDEHGRKRIEVGE